MNKTQSEQKQRLAARAYALFREFRRAYTGEWERLGNCERMYRGDHWHGVPLRDPNEPRPVTPVIQSTVENIAAELMDRVPEAVIAPEAPEDAQLAAVLQAVIAQNHDAACYAREYRDLVHDLLVSGYCVQEVGFDPRAAGGLGAAFVRHVDVRSILFDPAATALQDGRAVFKLGLRTRDFMAQHFPEHAPFLTDDGYRAGDAAADEVLLPDRRDTLLLLEYWWREYDAESGQYRVHMAQLCAGRVLRDSRDQKPEGYFAHGMYPFVLTPLFPRRGSCLGLGYVDMFETQQRYADKLDQIVLKNALMASHNKILLTESSGFDAEDLRDWSRDVHRGESLSGITWFTTPALPAYLLDYIRTIRESIKQESGANDFSRGQVTAGVTAASAIASLQEMSNKRARTASRLLHEAFRDAVRMEIDVEREFSLFTRRVTVDIGGKRVPCTFESAMLLREAPGRVLLPVEFYVSVKVQQQTPAAAMSRNELALRMLQAGILRPPQAAAMMVFDGKEQVLKELHEQRDTQALEGERR